MPKTILCYGDSNTWGFVAGTRNYETGYVERYDYNTRWTGLLQSRLGQTYHVIEEGLNGRTTNLDDPVPPNRNGKTYLLPCLYSHAPLDLVILALGGNDLKTCFNRSPEEVCVGLSELIDIIQTSKYGSDMQSAPQILILSPIIPLTISETFCDNNGISIFSNGIKRSKALLPLYRELSQKKKCHFLEIADRVIPSPIDGVHLDVTAHATLAQLIFEKIRVS